MVSFHVPENASVTSATLKLNAKNVDDTRYYSQNATDVKIYINSGDPFYTDGTTEGCYYYTDRGYFCNRNIVGVMNPSLNFDITGSVISGTNVVSVYLNSYGDRHW